MMEKGAAERELLRIIRYTLCRNVPESEINDWYDLIGLAQRHELTQFVAEYVKSLPEERKPSKEILNQLRSAETVVYMKLVLQSDALSRMEAQFEADGIDWLPFKGSVTRKRYPSETLRTMGDIDLLYRSEQHAAFRAAMDALQFDDYKEGRKNDTYSQEPGLVVEAHRELVPASSSFAAYCSGVWKRAHLRDGCSHTWEMRIEDEYVFHLIHMAIHLLQGGVGIRFLVDAFVYEQQSMDRKYLRQELEAADLINFHATVSALVESWFADGKKTEIVEKLAEFILNSGTFGSQETSSAAAVSEGRLRFLIRACFPGYKDMVSMFPWLGGKPFLLPWAWVQRMFRGLVYRRGNVISQFNRMASGDIAKGKELKQFFMDCGLRGNL